MRKKYLRKEKRGVLQQQLLHVQLKLLTYTEPITFRIWQIVTQMRASKGYLGMRNVKNRKYCQPS